MKNPKAYKRLRIACEKEKKNLVDNYKTIGIPPMNSSSTCWLKPDDLKSLLEKKGFTVNITDFNVKEEEKKQKNNNASINNEINGFRKQYKKNVEQNQPNTSEFQINFNGNKNSNEINEDIKENNNNKDEISENIEKEDDDELTKHLYKTKLNSCKQVRLKKKFL